jgi:hypothetical protein
MPAKLRVAKQLRPQFSADVLALFVQLERTPPRRRGSQVFKDGEHELVRRLNLTNEYWTMNSVLDRKPSCHPPGYAAHTDWHRCREVRLALLEAAGLETAPRRVN